MTEAAISVTPDGVQAETALEKQRREKIAEQERELAELEKKIPKPAGYHILMEIVKFLSQIKQLEMSTFCLS